jgi:antirestriction protein ArdC
MATVYDLITDRILEKLQHGTVPWQKPWNSAAGLPRNLFNQKPYRGINVWVLGAAGYTSLYWLTFKQAKEIGGHVRKGEQGSPVVFWKWLEKDDARQNREEIRTDSRRIPLARLYSVFNIQQCELPARLQPLLAIPTAPGADTYQQLAACEQILANMPNRPSIEHGEARAYYKPMQDLVNMPTRGLFPKVERYYSVLFHELTHSTGHWQRLNRPTLTDLCPFGSTNYSKEELVAEMGAAFLCGVAGIANETIDTSTAYIQGWLTKLKNDTRLIILAAAQAQKAADYILGKEATQEEMKLDS